MSLKDELIKLGNEAPQLRDHIRPVISSLDDQSSRTAGGDMLNRNLHMQMQELTKSVVAEVVSSAERKYRTLSDPNFSKSGLSATLLGMDGDLYVDINFANAMTDNISAFVEVKENLSRGDTLAREVVEFDGMTRGREMVKGLMGAVDKALKKGLA